MLPTKEGGNLGGSCLGLNAQPRCELYLKTIRFAKGLRCSGYASSMEFVKSLLQDENLNMKTNTKIFILQNLLECFSRFCALARFPEVDLKRSMQN